MLAAALDAPQGLTAFGLGVAATRPLGELRDGREVIGPRGGDDGDRDAVVMVILLCLGIETQRLYVVRDASSAHRGRCLCSGNPKPKWGTRCRRPREGEPHVDKTKKFCESPRLVPSSLRTQVRVSSFFKHVASNVYTNRSTPSRCKIHPPPEKISEKCPDIRCPISD